MILSSKTPILLVDDEFFTFTSDYKIPLKFMHQATYATCRFLSLKNIQAIQFRVMIETIMPIELEFMDCPETVLAWSGVSGADGLINSLRSFCHTAKAKSLLNMLIKQPLINKTEILERQIFLKEILSADDLDNLISKYEANLKQILNIKSYLNLLAYNHTNLKSWSAVLRQLPLYKDTLSIMSNIFRSKNEFKFMGVKFSKEDIDIMHNAVSKGNYRERF